MKIEIQVKPNSRKQSVELLSSGIYKVSVNAPPQDGRANEALIELLAQHFKVRKSAVTIVRGHSARKKLIEIAG